MTKPPKRLLPSGLFSCLNTMTEYLSTEELRGLTGWVQRNRRLQWLAQRGIPHQQDGGRIIVSRIHVQRWLEGQRNTPHSGMNLAAIK